MPGRLHADFTETGHQQGRPESAIVRPSPSLPPRAHASMTDQPRIALNDGRHIPQVGLGVWQTPNDEVAGAVQAALAAGYRHVDTASIYGNEEGVGVGL